MLPVSLTFAGAFALFNMFLAYRCSKVRMSGKVPVGDGGNPLMLSRMRAHANFVEYTPFVLILIALIETCGGEKNWLWGIGIVYLIGRIGHAFGMDRPAPNPFRAGGALVTWVVMLGLAGWAIWMASHPPVPVVHYL